MRGKCLAACALGALSLAIAVGGCSSRAATSAPPAASPSSEVGRFVWQDLVTNDAAKCRSFYAQLLGWEFEETNRFERPYLIAKLDGRNVGGIVEAKPDVVKRAAWLSYLVVANLDEAVKQATKGGAELLVAPTPVESYGHIAVLKDPQGAFIGLASLAVTVPAEPAQPALGRFFWREYLASDPVAALGFYKELAGFESSITEKVAALEYHVLRTQRPRAGLFRIPSDAKDITPNWLPYVKVEDPAALAAKATSLGGKVLVAPRPEIRKGTLAVVADPTGGAIALQKWPIEG